MKAVNGRHMSDKGFFGYTQGSDEILAELFVSAVEHIARGVRYGIELADEKINQEIYKEKAREKLNILEYAENAKNKKSLKKT